MSTKSFPVLTHLIVPSPSPKPHLIPSTSSHFLSFPQNPLPFTANVHHHKPFKINPLLCSSSTNSSNNAPSDQSQSQSQSHSLTLTQQAIYDYLSELGISQDDCAFISSNSPKYAQMLNDSVQDLEEWKSWRSSSSGSNKNDVGNGDGEESVLIGFKEKVVRMAKEKGDNGKVAFLESLGLSLSSAISIARYLSGEPLPPLIHKVKYMKEIFFSGSNTERMLGKNAPAALPRAEVDALNQIAKTMGARDWTFDANACDLNDILPVQELDPTRNITCNRGLDNTHHITEIQFKHCNLSGTLPPELVQLPSIQKVDFAYNYLNGSIPVEWTLLQLKFISVFGNRLSGNIPSYLADITSLTYLDIEANQFSGTVPQEFRKLVNLGTLRLSSIS